MTCKNCGEILEYSKKELESQRKFFCPFCGCTIYYNGKKCRKLKDQEEK